MLYKYFSGTAILTPFLSVVRVDLYSNDKKLFGIFWLSTVKLTFPSILFLFN